MQAIKLTEEKRDKVLLLIDYFYEDSKYGSYDNFKHETNSDIVLVSSDDDNFILSCTVLEDPIYDELITFLKAGMGIAFKPVEVNVKNDNF